MKKHPIFTGAAVALVTPMLSDGSIHWKRLGELIDWQIEHQTDAIVICGTTGESSTMTDEEHLESIQFAVEHVAGRIPVIAGAGSNDTAYAVMLSKEAKKAGADALLQVTPYYNKTSQQGLIQHFSTIADATDLPIILYNVPSRTGVDIKPETYCQLAKHPNIVAVKEANGNLSSLAKTIALCEGELDIYSGNDDQILPILSLGGLGVISVFSNICPRVAHQMVTAYLNGDISTSRTLQLKWLRLINDLFLDVNPIPVKEAMNLLGMDVGHCRLPLVPMEDKAQLALKETLEHYELLKK